MRATLEHLASRAFELGFTACNVAPAIHPQGFSRLVEWIESGFAGEMGYFRKRLEAYEHPTGVMEGTRTIVVLTFPYPSLANTSIPPKPGTGKIARYTWIGGDYHDQIHDKLQSLKADLLALHPGAKARGVVDTAPLLERDFARLAGLGWQAKNTLLINKHVGSYFFLACLLTDLDLPLSTPHETSHCGTCTRCLDACPTSAFPQPGVLDSRLCISYLTIESRDAIPMSLRSGIGDWLFGCDVCQEVCPWNRPKRNLAGQDRTGVPVEQTVINLVELFGLSDEDFRRRYRHTPFWRVRRRGLLRNAAIVLGNQGATAAEVDPHVVSALELGIADDEPIVRGASAWALRQLNSPNSLRILAQRRLVETDTYVLSEIDGQFTQ